MISSGAGRKRALVAVAAGLALVVVAGAAIAASTDVFDPKAEREAFQAAVADRLGVTTKQLEDAYKAAALERLDAAVEAGRLTQEQADAVRERIESGAVGRLGFGPMFGMHGFGKHEGGRHLDAAADYLGLTRVELREKLAAGQSLAEIAKSEGKSVDGLKAALLAAAKAKLDAAVEDGKITAAQRDEMLERLESKLDDIVSRTGPPSGRQGFGFRHGGPGPGFGGPPDA